MKRFVIRQNIEHYRAMLTVTTDPAQRVQIAELLHADSDVYKGGADLFYMPEGKGAGIWALRSSGANAGRGRLLQRR